MATVYNVEIVSHWVNYPNDVLEQKLKEAIKTLEDNGNTIDVKVKQIDRL